MSNISPQQAREILWRKGDLKYLLDDNQRVLHSLYKDSKEKVNVWLLSRGSGKSYCLVVIAIEECLKHPNSLVKFTCDKQRNARQIIQPLFRKVIEDCPKDIKPEYNVSESCFKFANGSAIQLAGLDNGNAESIRGGSARLCIVDEAGSRGLTDLKYIVRSILIPAVTRTKEIDGKVLLASTPPLKASHPFVHFIKRAEYQRNLVIRDIYTNPRMTQSMIDKLIDECGGEDSPDFRREYLCEIINSVDSSVIPEFSKGLQEKVVKEHKRPPFFDSYVSMDLGIKDFTVVLFAYYDFKANKVIIEDEYVHHGEKFHTGVLAENIKLKEQEHFCDPLSGEVIPPYKRVSDNNLFVINDLYHIHGLSFQPTRKDEKIAAINNLRILLAEEGIIIHPRCETLIRHLKDATWAKNAKTYDRSDGDKSHYDAVDALSYLIRNIDFQRNPYPPAYQMANMFYMKNQKHENPSVDTVKKLLNIRS